MHHRTRLIVGTSCSLWKIYTLFVSTSLSSIVSCFYSISPCQDTDMMDTRSKALPAYNSYSKKWVQLDFIGKCWFFAENVVVSTSCSLLHSAVDLKNETKLDAELKSWLAFAAQKLLEVVALASAAAGKKDEVWCFLSTSRLCYNMCWVCIWSHSHFAPQPSKWGHQQVESECWLKSLSGSNLGIDTANQLIMTPSMCFLLGTDLTLTLWSFICVQLCWGSVVLVTL